MFINSVNTLNAAQKLFRVPRKDFWGKDVIFRDNVIEFNSSSEVIHETQNKVLLDMATENTYFGLISSRSDEEESSKNVTRIKAESAEKELDELFFSCKKKYESIFYRTAVSEYIEDGYISDSMKVFDKIYNEYSGTISGKFLDFMYLRNVSNTKVIKSILYILANNEVNQLGGIELPILSYALLNADYELKDLALQCFERWKSPKYLDMLKSFNLGIDFLDEYRLSIIAITEELNY